MGDNQSGKTEKKRSNIGRRIALIGGGATVLAIMNIMSGGSEAQSQPILILEYAAFAGGLFALIAGLIMMLTQN
jgi:succinate-acetate transporter protein